jgi:bifunctional pyridoxal-dependent enzyme with beta-cystathionase and maltose regulon repressor activities
MWLDCTALAERIGAKRLADEATRKTPGAPVPPERILERWFVENAKVSLNPGNTYGKGSDNHMRMNIATSRKTLQLALDNIAAATRRTGGTAM